MKEEKLRITFSPYKETIITRASYIDILKKFRNLNVPYREGLDMLVNSILSIATLDVDIKRICACDVTKLAKMIYVNGINLNDWYNMYKYYVQKNKETKKRRKVTPVETDPLEEVLGEMHCNRTDGLDNITTEYEITFNVSDGKLRVYTKSPRKPVGMIQFNFDSHTLSTYGTVPIEVLAFLNAWANI